jgi:SAM-dependent methyltransferase
MSTVTREEALTEALGREWYHTIELAPGKTTSGFCDLRPYASKVLPDDLSGQRVLDVGTFDGFWAFELEKRGPAEVLATDLEGHDEMDWSLPFRAELRKEMEETGTFPRERFMLARRALESNVNWVGCSIYDLEPDRLPGGPVDMAFIGALLLHLRDPAKGLEHVRSVLKPGGKIVLFEPFDRMLTRFGRNRPLAALRGGRYKRDWWVCNIAGLKDLLVLGGFEQIEVVGRPENVKSSVGYSQWHTGLQAVARTDL